MNQKKDKYWKFESYISKWISNHLGLVICIITPILIWLMLCFATISIFGLVGANEFDKVTIINHDSGKMTDEAFNLSQNVILPITVDMLNTMVFIIIMIPGLYGLLIIYWIYRYTDRRKREYL